MDIYAILVLMHIIGTVLGVGAATFAEINILHQLHEGNKDPDESLILQITYNVLRIGLFILVISGFGFLIYYNTIGFQGYAFSPQFWTKLSIIGIIAANAVLLHLRLIPFAWGSAIAITSWYTVLTLGVLRGIEFAVMDIVIVYLLVIVLMHYIFSKLRKRFATVTQE